MSNVAFGLDNYIVGATLYGYYSGGGMSPVNWLDDSGSPSVAWQTPAGVKTLATGALASVTPATGARVWGLLALFRTNLTAAASINFTLWNTSGPTAVWTTTVAGPDAGYGQVVVFPPNITADYVQFYIDDATNPDNFVNVPLVYFGPATSPIGPLAWGTTHGRDDGTDEQVSLGGQEYPNNHWQRRRWEISHDALRADEAWGFIDTLDRLGRRGGNILFVPDVTSSLVRRQATFGRLKATADISYPYEAADRRAWRARITERL